MKARAGLLLVAGAFLSTGSLAETKFSPWGTPVNLAADEAGVLHCGGINTAANDAGPAISKDGLSLYFSSNRPGGVGDNDLYVVQRRSADSAWGAPSNLRDINTPSVDSVPALSRDGHWLFFNSSRPGGFGDVDLWASYRRHTHDDFAWESPMNLGPGVNTAGFEAGAGYFENEDGKPLLYFNRGQPGPANQTNNTTDIWVAELQPDGTFGDARAVTELNSPLGDQRPSVRFDGLEVIFFSNRSGSVPQPDGVTPSTDLWVSTRKDVRDPWGEPVNLGAPINTSAGEFNPQLSPDGLTLYFGSSRSGGCGNFDLWMSTRTRIQGND